MEQYCEWCGMTVPIEPDGRCFLGHSGKLRGAPTSVASTAGPVAATGVQQGPAFAADDAGPDVDGPLDAPTKKRWWRRGTDKPKRLSRAERKRAEKEAAEAVTLTDDAWWQGDDMDLSAMVTVPAAAHENVQGPPAAEVAPPASDADAAPPTPAPAPPETSVPAPEPRPTLTLPPGAWSALLGSVAETPRAPAPTGSPTPPPPARTGEGEPSGSAETSGSMPEPPAPEPPVHSVLSAPLALQEVDRARAPSHEGRADRS